MTEAIWSEQAAASYDTNAASMFDPAIVEPTVDFLAELAGDGRAVEFGIGTGRIALPLQARGVRVSGVDVSRPMLDQLRRKPGAESIDVVVGSCANARAEGVFTLVYAVSNTFTNLLTQSEQIDCFRNAADHLSPGGYFLIEGGAPTVVGDSGQRYSIFTVSPDHLGFDEVVDGVEQLLTSHHYFFSGDRVTIWDSPHRFVWPSELDLMAKLAGLELHGKWQSWDKQPFTDTSTSHVSVWRKPT